MATVMETIDAYAKARSSKPVEHENPIVEAERERKPATEEQIAVLAYRLWQERGCPIGSPEIDWFRAEQELRTSSSNEFEAE